MARLRLACGAGEGGAVFFHQRRTFQAGEGVPGQHVRTAARRGDRVGVRGTGIRLAERRNDLNTGAITALSGISGGRRPEKRWMTLCQWLGARNDGSVPALMLITLPGKGIE